jgi:hypothetical protein
VCLGNLIECKRKRPTDVRRVRGGLIIEQRQLAQRNSNTSIAWPASTEIPNTSGWPRANTSYPMLLSLDRETGKLGLPPFGAFLVHETDPRMMRLCLLVHATLAPGSCENSRPSPVKMLNSLRYLVFELGRCAVVMEPASSF